jgi:hypothetical protein
MTNTMKTDMHDEATATEATEMEPRTHKKEGVRKEIFAIIEEMVQSLHAIMDKFHEMVGHARDVYDRVMEIIRFFRSIAVI